MISESPAVNAQELTELTKKCYWSHVDKNGPVPPKIPELGCCWPWKACFTKKGYGRMVRLINGKKKQVLAHRIGYALQRGPVPENLRVLHHCDNRACQRGSHMYLGTDAENMRDCALRETRKTKITNAQVVELLGLADKHTQQFLADKYRISRVQVSRIIHGKRRQHVEVGGLDTASPQ